MNPAERHICLIAPNMNGGGAERVILTLCEALSKEKKCKVDLVLLKRKGVLLPLIPGEVRLFILRKRLHTLALGIRPLKEKLLVKRMANYIDAEKPGVILGFLPSAYATALLARKSAGHKPPIISSVRSFIDNHNLDRRLHTVKLLAESDLVHGVSEDLVKSLPKLGVAEEKLVTIYNPVWRESLLERKRQPLDHPWFNRKDGAKIIISAGRLEPVKDHETLLRAFLLLAEKRKARLILLGEGKDKRRLKNIARKLGIESQILLPGFVENPLPWFVRSDLFVLSSRREGLPNVLVEALACDCPVVSTNCPYGPREILEDGRFGKLTPVGDPEKLAEAMEATLDNPPDPNELVNRAKFFSEERVIPQYKKMLGVPD